MGQSVMVSPLVLAELLQRDRAWQAPSATVLDAGGRAAGRGLGGDRRLLMRAQGVKAASRSGAAAWAGIVAVAVLSQAAPGFAVAWMLLLLGFAGANKVLVGVGFFTFWHICPGIITCWRCRWLRNPYGCRSPVWRC